MKARLILFKDGRRLEKRYEDHRDAVTIVRTLRKKGVKATVATCLVVNARKYPPADDDLHARDEGMLWCPYCGAWRWFKVPKFTPHTKVMTAPWIMNSMHRQDIRVCAWCQISLHDFWVRKANGITAETAGTRRRKKKRRVR